MSVSSIPVLFVANGPYFQHAAVTMASLLVNNVGRNFALTVATDTAYPVEEARLTAMVEGFGNATIRFVVFGLTRMQGLPTRLHLTLLTYMRLFAADIFGEDVARVLYLDTDLVVNGDIGDLWAVDMGAAPIAGAPDIYIDQQRAGTPGTYINAGVLLLNLDQWRREEAGAKLIAYIAAHPDLPYLDQDALNEVFAGRIHILPLRWNFQARMAEAGSALLGMSAEEYRRTRAYPGIVHYTTGSKPWMYRKDVHYTGLYYRYLALTPWRDYCAPDKTLRRRISKAVRLIALRRWIRKMRAG